MRTARRNKTALILVTVILAALVAALVIGLLSKKEPEDPHKGQVYIYDGFDWIWMTPLEGVPANELTEESFSSNDGRIEYTGTDYDVLRGVDVSEHQLDIDWKQVAASGVDYAYIRVGWRGYTEGGLFEDAYFERNIQGALDAGLHVGVYMFSQAVTVQEAIEEADFVLERIWKYNVTLPVVFDWEKIEAAEARSHGLTMELRTDCARAFCETVKSAGYVPCVYFNRNLGYYGYDLTRLTDYEFWFSLPESGFPNFYYACDMWQYSFTETVPGIAEPTDMNLWFIAKPKVSPSPDAEK
ncbi:MAG: glycoside hydrolase family 25 protein [Candidatus Limivicinus sp.]|nr:glycoside hydrolase family 25 protein [Candidatus Limivicinus sp.]